MGDEDWLQSLPSYVTTLQSRSHDRLDHFQKRTATPVYSGVAKTPLSIFSANPSPLGGKYGCWESHMATLLMAERDHPSSPSLHFEDDATCTAAGWWDATTRVAVLREIKLVMDVVDPMWRIIGLGGCPLAYSLGSGALPNGIHHVLRTGFAETHAYIISPRFRKHILDNTTYEGHVDYLYAREAGSHAYLVTPELFVQQESLGSDNKSLLHYVTALRAPYKKIQFGIAHQLSRTRPNTPWRVMSLFLLLALWCTAVVDVCIHTALLIGRAETVCVLLATCMIVAFEIANARILDPQVHKQTSPLHAQSCARSVAVTTLSRH